MRYFKRLIITFILSTIIFICTDVLKPSFKLILFIISSIFNIGNIENITSLEQLLQAPTNIIITTVLLEIAIITIILMLIQRILILCINSYKIKEKQN